MKFNLDESVAFWQVGHMLSLQDEMNTQVHPNWREQNYPWYRAIWTECAELMDHHGWKWWKHQEANQEQVHLELVDIWHFGMSWLLQKYGPDNEPTAELVQTLQLTQGHNTSFLKLVETLALSAVTHRQFVPAQFARLMMAADMSLDELYRLYIGKNTLNRFRQDFGYKEGTYHKIWDGREDNDYLYELLKTLDSTTPAFMSQVYNGLAAKYPQIH